MQVNPSFGNSYKPTKKDYARSAASGALVTSGFYAASTGLSFLTRKADMLQIINDVGGKAKYAKTFAIGLGIMATMGAAFSTLFTAIASKVHSHKPPKAVN